MSWRFSFLAAVCSMLVLPTCALSKPRVVATSTPIPAMAAGTHVLSRPVAGELVTGKELRFDPYIDPCGYRINYYLVDKRGVEKLWRSDGHNTDFIKETNKLRQSLSVRRLCSGEIILPGKYYLLVKAEGRITQDSSLTAVRPMGDIIARSEEFEIPQDKKTIVMTSDGCYTNVETDCSHP